MKTTLACQECQKGELDRIHNYADEKDFHQFVYHLDDLTRPKTELEQAVDVICDLRSMLWWCGGSPDFQPEGKARVGWVEGPAKSVDRATEFIKKLEA